jgi:hypothetical protein
LGILNKKDVDEADVNGRYAVDGYVFGYEDTVVLFVPSVDGLIRSNIGDFDDKLNNYSHCDMYVFQQSQ